MLIALALILCAPAIGEEWLIEHVNPPQTGSIGGEWAVIALACGGADVPDGYYEGYLDALEQTLIACGGVLHAVKYTEYSRTALALAALGINPADFRGFNVIEPLKDIDKVKIQGNNGPIWALIALDANDYEGFDETRAALLDQVIAAQNADGGYGISPTGESNPDMTAMAITALTAHQDDERASECIQSAVAFLKSYESELENNCETTVWLMIAYCSLDMKEDAERLRGMIDQYALDGAYRHVLEQEKPDGMATEQAAYGLVAYERMLNGENRLFDMRDVNP